MKFKYLTPKLLRDAADNLRSNAFGYGGRVGSTHMCVAMREGRGQEEFSAYLHSERLTQFVDSAIKDFVFGTADWKEQQEIRFMFLEFLALYIESEYSQDSKQEEKVG